MEDNSSQPIKTNTQVVEYVRAFMETHPLKKGVKYNSPDMVTKNEGFVLPPSLSEAEKEREIESANIDLLVCFLEEDLAEIDKYGDPFRFIKMKELKNEIQKYLSKFDHDEKQKSIVRRNIEELINYVGNRNEDLEQKVYYLFDPVNFES